MKSKTKIICLVASIFLFSLSTAAPALATSLYGALYEVGNLVSADGLNKEIVLAYYPSADGFIALTANDTGLEWWTSDSLGMNWVVSDSNPLAEYGCTMAGRHTVITYNDEVYFAATCGQDANIFKLTGLESAELVHTNSLCEESEFTLGYPTASLLNGNLYMFFNGGYTVFDGSTWEEVTDAEGQVDGVPLEVSSEQDGFVYEAQTTGQVQIFDGTTLDTIGENYLEELTISPDANLPAIEAFNDKVYVGNADFANGASIFRYDGSTWDEYYQLGSEDSIVNKMQLSDEIDGSNYLVFYTANSTLGTTIYAINEQEDVIQLINSGLGGNDPENNSEVVSIVNRTVSDNGTEKDIMLFGTKNMIDNGKVFVLDLGTDLAINASRGNVISAPNTMAVKKATTKKGKVFKYKIRKSLVKKGEVYSLWINGKQVAKKKASKKKAVTLTYKKVKYKKVGESFNVKIGVKHIYGTGDNRTLARNVILGKRIKVTVRK
ncbi:MAG: hypothetical protein V1898_00155 [Patescibacteria group bacterium]